MCTVSARPVQSSSRGTLSRGQLVSSERELQLALTTEKRIMKIQRTKTALINASLGAQKQRASLADIKKIFGLDEADSEDEAL